MPVTEYVAGLVWLAGALGAAGYAAWRLTQARLRWMAPEARAVAGCALMCAAVALSTGVPLALGALSRGAVLVTALILAVAARAVPAAGPATEEGARGIASDAKERLVAGAFVAGGLVLVLAHLRTAAVLGAIDDDTRGFIVPILGNWLQGGGLWDAYDPVAGWGFGAYPNTGGLLQLAAMLPWRSDFGLRFVGPALMAFAALAVYALACELGARRAVAAVAATLAMGLPTALFSALVAHQTDALAAAGIVGGALFLARHARTRRRSGFVLAALAFGLAFGTKWYGPPEIAAVLVVWCIARLRAGDGARVVVTTGAGLGVAILAVGGFWLVRNAIVYGNPLFPQAIGPLGIDAPRRGLNLTAAGDSRLLRYLTQPDVLADPIAGQFWRSWTLAGICAAAGAATALVLGRRVDGRARALAAAALAVLATYVVLPLTALHPDLVVAATRYAVPGFALAAAVTAVLVSGLGARGRMVSGVAAAMALALALRSWRDFAPGTVVLRPSALVQAVLVVGAGALLWHGIRSGRLRGAALAAAVAGATVVAASAGRHFEERFLADRYRGEDPVSDFLLDKAGSGRRVGITGPLAGTRPLTISAYGPRFENTVVFVGPRVDELQVRDTSEEAFVGRLRFEAVDLLLVGPVPERPDELGWAQGAGWSVAASSPSWTLLRRPGS